MVRYCNGGFAGACVSCFFLITALLIASNYPTLLVAPTDPH